MSYASEQVDILHAITARLDDELKALEDAVERLEEQREIHRERLDSNEAHIKQLGRILVMHGLWKDP